MIDKTTPPTADILDALRDPRHSGHLNSAAADEIERLRRYAHNADAWLASQNELTRFRAYCEHEGIAAP